MPWVPALILALMVFTGTFAPALAPHDPRASNLADAFKPPVWLSGGSSTYLLGTDSVGRDILSRMIYGARVSLVVAVMGVAFAGAVGGALGVVSGYFGGWVDIAIMRVTEVVMALPTILFALVLVAVLGASLWNVVLVVSLVFWARYARQIRAEALSLRERDFVKASEAIGARPWRILVFHIFPNTINTLIVVMTLQLGQVILLEAVLSFLGAGIPPPDPAWGQMVASGRDFVVRAWWISLLPGLAITFTVLSMNLMGDWLRDLLDPKQRNT